jgi:hypothetical protein
VPSEPLPRYRAKVALAAASAPWRSAAYRTQATGPALGACEDTRLLTSGVTEELISDLLRFPDFHLYSAPTSFRHHATVDPEELGRSGSTMGQGQRAIDDGKGLAP